MMIIPLFMEICKEYPNIIKYVGFISVLVVCAVLVISVIKNTKKDTSFYKPIFGLLITLIVFCIKPASDIYYYAAGLISIAFSIWAFYNIINKFNILTTRKLPQLGARGGDENA